MSSGSWLLWLKVLGLLAAGIGFGWWQLRDVSRSQAESQRPDGPAGLRTQAWTENPERSD